MAKFTHAAANEATGNVHKIQEEGALGVQVTGSGTYTLLPEATMEDPSESDAVWQGVALVDETTKAAVSSVTAPGAWYVDLPGFKGFRMRNSIAGTGTPTSWIGEALLQ